jgi:type VI secretion system secreted protein VgrG
MADEKLLAGIHIAFISGSMKDDEVELVGVVGRERLSQLFEYDLVLRRAAGPYTDDELDGLLRAPCAITLGPRAGDVVHGLLSSIELIDAEQNDAARYLARLVPHAWLLTMTRSSRIYQDVKVPDMVKAILARYGLRAGTDFDIHTSIAAKSPVREYIAQYQESDWDFIQRWLEQEGYFYWFAHSKSEEKLIIADANQAATPIDDPSHISYRERNNLSTNGAATVWDWNVRQRRIPSRVSVQDYNYRTPSIALYVSETVDQARGFGTVSYYGEHFKDKDTGKAVAKLRAEQILCQRRTVYARTDCSRFRVGHTFQLENHREGAYDGLYLITAIEHRVGWPVPSADSLNSGIGRAEHDEGGTTVQPYTARFEAILASVAYRPERVTPWPRINGIMHGHIDADSSGQYAMLDAQGRYRVRLPFDLAGGKGTKASRLVRMAQPYSGSGYGSHHPLHKGTEVIVAYVDGDPDRPIIVGSVPNPSTQSPSASSNATQSVTQTASGIRVEMEDLQR